MTEDQMKILVVDDDPFMREILLMVLEGGDYLVETAENGVDAYGKCATDENIGMIVSDMNMPEMNGLELTRELRGVGADVPIIVLTGDDDADTEREVMESGANGCLVKGGDLQDVLLETVEKVLEEYRLKKASV